MDMEYVNSVRISDMPLAVTLCVLGFNIESLDPDPELNGRINFCFAPSQKLSEAQRAFYRGELRVNPLEYHLHQKALKSRLHALR